MATYTPIPYWMAMPMRQAFAWAKTAAKIQEEDRQRQGSG